MHPLYRYPANSTRFKRYSGHFESVNTPYHGWIKPLGKTLQFQSLNTNQPRGQHPKFLQSNLQRSTLRPETNPTRYPSKRSGSSDKNVHLGDSLFCLIYFRQSSLSARRWLTVNRSWRTADIQRGSCGVSRWRIACSGRQCYHHAAYPLQHPQPPQKSTTHQDTCFNCVSMCFSVFWQWMCIIVWCLSHWCAGLRWLTKTNYFTRHIAIFLHISNQIANYYTICNVLTVKLCLHIPKILNQWLLSEPRYTLQRLQISIV